MKIIISKNIVIPVALKDAQRPWRGYVRLSNLRRCGLTIKSIIYKRLILHFKFNLVAFDTLIGINLFEFFIIPKLSIWYCPTFRSKKFGIFGYFQKDLKVWNLDKKINFSTREFMAKNLYEDDSYRAEHAMNLSFLRNYRLSSKINETVSSGLLVNMRNDYYMDTNYRLGINFFETYGSVSFHLTSDTCISLFESVKKNSDSSLKSPKEKPNLLNLNKKNKKWNKNSIKSKKSKDSSDVYIAQPLKELEENSDISFSSGDKIDMNITPLLKESKESEECLTTSSMSKKMLMEKINSMKIEAESIQLIPIAPATMASMTVNSKNNVVLTPWIIVIVLSFKIVDRFFRRK
uniref:Uncharacterized protein n=1 Tax=Avrainvillea mazei TaxID=381412 RepID=A0A1X9RPR8_9CHLO|nr:hypothetical protein [Avrainvillea mazei]